MALYLVHEPTIYWINCINYGPYEDGKPEDFEGLPPWAIPIHIVVSVILGMLLTLYLEDPARKKLNKWLKKA